MYEEVHIPKVSVASFPCLPSLLWKKLWNETNAWRSFSAISFGPLGIHGTENLNLVSRLGLGKVNRISGAVQSN